MILAIRTHMPQMVGILIASEFKFFRNKFICLFLLFGVQRMVKKNFFTGVFVSWFLFLVWRGQSATKVEGQGLGGFSRTQMESSVDAVFRSR